MYTVYIVIFCFDWSPWQKMLYTRSFLLLIGDCIYFVYNIYETFGIKYFSLIFFRWKISSWTVISNKINYYYIVLFKNMLLMKKKYIFQFSKKRNRSLTISTSYLWKTDARIHTNLLLIYLIVVMETFQYSWRVLWILHNFYFPRKVSVDPGGSFVENWIN